MQLAEAFGPMDEGAGFFRALHEANIQIFNIPNPDANAPLVKPMPDQL